VSLQLEFGICAKNKDLNQGLHLFPAPKNVKYKRVCEPNPPHHNLGLFWLEKPDFSFIYGKPFYMTVTV